MERKDLTGQAGQAQISQIKNGIMKRDKWAGADSID